MQMKTVFPWKTNSLKSKTKVIVLNLILLRLSGRESNIGGVTSIWNHREGEREGEGVRVDGFW